jgi:hypothetical protein
MAAKSLALAEDLVILQGSIEKFFGNVNVMNKESASGGLLGEAEPEHPDDVDLNKVSKPIIVKLPLIGNPKSFMVKILSWLLRRTLQS